MEIVLYVILGVLAIPMAMLLLYPFANHLTFLQKYYCRIGWHCHSKDYEYDYFDGASEHCTCKWCGYKGMIDSQGNLF